MSEKNGEIASELYDQIEDMTSAPIPVDCKKIIHEALDTQAREYEALIGVLVEAIKEFGAHEQDCTCYGDTDGNGEEVVHSVDCLDCDCGLREVISHPLVQEYLKKTSLAGQSKKEK